MFSFVRFPLANLVKMWDQVYNGQPLRKDSSVALISLQGLTFVLDKTCGFSFHDQYLKDLKLNPIERCWKISFKETIFKFQHVIKHGTKYKLVLLIAKGL